MYDHAGNCKRAPEEGRALTKAAPPPVPSTTELDAFYKAINEAKKKPAILKITQPFAETFIPMLSQSVFPMPIAELYNPAALDMAFPDLLKECEKIFDSIKVIVIDLLIIVWIIFYYYFLTYR